MSFTTYTFQSLDYPSPAPATLLATLAYDINNTGTAVGFYTDTLGQHGYLYDIASGAYTITPTALTGINDAGQVTSGFSPARDINNLNVALPIIGPAVNYPSASLTLAEGLNDLGTIVGGYTQGGVQYGFSFSNGTYSTLMFPDSQFTVAFGVNNSGLVVGNFVMAAGSPHEGFLFDGSTYTQLSFPGATATEIFGINDAGDLAGTWWDGNNMAHGFIAFDPPVGGLAVPEPSTLMILAMALATGCMIRKLLSQAA